MHVLHASILFPLSYLSCLPLLKLKEVIIFNHSIFGSPYELFAYVVLAACMHRWIYFRHF